METVAIQKAIRKVMQIILNKGTEIVVILGFLSLKLPLEMVLLLAILDTKVGQIIKNIGIVPPAP